MLLATKVPVRSAEAILDATELLFETIPEEYRVSMTYDNGKECCFGPITKQHAKYLAMEKCFGDTEEDRARAQTIAIEEGYFQMYQ